MTQEDVEAVLDELSERVSDCEMKGTSPDVVLSAEEKTVHWACVAYGAISSGGFGRLYEDRRLVMRDLVQFFGKLQLVDIADAIAVANAEFPGGKPPTDEQEYFRETRGIDFERFLEREKAVTRHGWRGLMQAIGSFISANRAGFRLPGVPTN